jgi:hypothetical protein
MTFGWRRWNAWVLVLVFALIQGWAPLLHAHVALPGGSTAGQPADTPARGIHLPDGALPAPHTHPTDGHVTVHARCESGEGMMVTAAVEHRRDERLLAADWGPASPGVADLPRRNPVSALLHWHPDASVRPHRVDSAPPFAAGPPSAA